MENNSVTFDYASIYASNFVQPLYFNEDKNEIEPLDLESDVTGPFLLGFRGCAFPPRFESHEQACQWLLTSPVVVALCVMDIIEFLRTNPDHEEKIYEKEVEKVSQEVS